MHSNRTRADTNSADGEQTHEDRRYIGYLISDVARLMRASFDRHVRQIGLTRAQWQVLSLLHRRPGASQTELAEMLEVERATAGRIIDRMARKNWVERRADATDRRINRLYLTAEAREVQAEMGRIAEDMLDDAMASLDDREKNLLADMLERVKVQLQSMAPRGSTKDAASTLTPALPPAGLLP
ncbi:MAG: MarR family transcriptional regulator [Acetobacteraceae bacterium]|nr:MarR family transcriptional regulator [Acetobacteraceae bacterium]